MISDFELARRLFPKAKVIVEKSGITQSRTTQVRGWATADSEDGSVTVVLDTDAAGTDAEITVPTTGGITEGSEVRVTLVDGAPVGCSQSGSIDVAQAIASAAQAIADAINQHFWTDDNGAHVTQVEQDEWNDQSSASYHSGPNALWNALGMLFRNGTNNLLALVAGNTPGVAIYDGQGNADSNIVASFTNSLIELGRNSINSVIKLCGGAFTIDTKIQSSWLVTQLYSDQDEDRAGEYSRSRTYLITKNHPDDGQVELFVHNGYRDDALGPDYGRDYQYPEQWIYEHKARVYAHATDTYSQVGVEGDELVMWYHNQQGFGDVDTLNMYDVHDILSGPSTVEVSTSSGVSVADSTNKSLVTLKLETPGLWLLIGHVVFPSNGTGLRASAIASNKDAGFSASATNSTVNLRATSGGVTAYSLIHLLTFSSGTLTRYLNVYQTSGSSLSVQGSIKAIRLGPAPASA